MRTASQLLETAREAVVMKLGFVLPNNWGIPDVNDVVDLAVEAEELGLDSVWVNHHVLNVGYVEDRLGDRPYHDALTVLTAAGGPHRTGAGSAPRCWCFPTSIRWCWPRPWPRSTS